MIRALSNGKYIHLEIKRECYSLGLYFAMIWWNSLIVSKYDSALNSYVYLAFLQRDLLLFVLQSSTQLIFGIAWTDRHTIFLCNVIYTISYIVHVSISCIVQEYYIGLGIWCMAFLYKIMLTSITLILYKSVYYIEFFSISICIENCIYNL